MSRKTTEVSSYSQSTICSKLKGRMILNDMLLITTAREKATCEIDKRPFSRVGEKSVTTLFLTRAILPCTRALFGPGVGLAQTRTNWTSRSLSWHRSHSFGTQKRPTSNARPLQQSQSEALAPSSSSLSYPINQRFFFFLAKSQSSKNQ